MHDPWYVYSTHDGPPCASYVVFTLTSITRHMRIVVLITKWVTTLIISITRTVCHRLVRPNIKHRHGIWKFNEEPICYWRLVGVNVTRHIPCRRLARPIGANVFLEAFPYVSYSREQDRQYTYNITLRCSLVTLHKHEVLNTMNLCLRRHANRISSASYHILISCLSGSTTFFHTVS
jgi:hypothetical protein